jgi:hypothetical protein
MTAVVVCDATMTFGRPAHCAETIRADAAHMGCACADATEVRAHSAELHGAHSTEMRAAETTDVADATETADMGSAHCADMTAAEAATETAVTTAAAASVSGASRGKSEHHDRCCCSENLRHDNLHI